MKPLNPDSDNLLPGISEERFLRVARKYVRSAYPNPDRIGCPGQNELAALARGKRFSKPEELEHVTTCSPCFIEYEAIRKNWKRTRGMLIAGAVAAAVAIAVFSGILWFRRAGVGVPNAPAGKSVEMARQTPKKEVLDLRPYERFRGEGGSGARRPGPAVLERANLDLTIQLPVGLEEGRYVFELIDSSGTRRFETSGDAAIINFVTTAEAPFDLRKIPAGQFRLTVRRMGRPVLAEYPVEVR